VQAIAQATAAFGIAAQHGQIAARLFQPTPHLRATEGIQRFVGEVDGRFHVDAQQHQLLDHRIDAAREHAIQRTTCRARGTVVARGDQVGDGLGLGQVELAVEERPFAELTRPRLARTERDAARDQLLQQHRAAVALQFHHFFAGEAVRCREPQHDAIVDDLAVGIAQARVVRVARAQCRRTQCVGDGRSARPDRRSRPTPPAPGALAMATMVSVRIASFMAQSFSSCARAWAAPLPCGCSAR
jgi:hypothetical protein